MTREVLIVLHAGRATNLRTAAEVARAAGRARHPAARDRGGVGRGHRRRPARPDLRPRIVEGRPGCAEGAEVVLVLGGDGTVLRAAELARPTGVPLLGVNLGHYGFLAEAEEEFLAGAVDAIACGHYAVEERMTIDAVARRNGDVLARTWALNEAAIEKSTPRADPGGGARGRRTAGVGVRLRRRAVRHPDRIHGLRVLRGRPAGVAAGGGAAAGAEQRPRPVRPADGDLAGQPRRGGGRPVRAARGARLRRAAHLPLPAGARVEVTRGVRRCAWCGSTGGRSPTAWCASSTFRCADGAVRPRRPTCRRRLPPCWPRCGSRASA